MTIPYIREHVFNKNVDGYGTDCCKFCNTRTGIGFYIFTRCKLRFNESGFNEFLEFRNISSKLTSDNKYVRRFSEEEFDKDTLKKEFIKLTKNSKEAKVIINQKKFAETNPM